MMRQWWRAAGMAAALAAALPAAAQKLFHLAENAVPVAIVDVDRTAKHTAITLQAQEALRRVCWAASGQDNPYLVAAGRRYRFLDGDDITACPLMRDYDARALMTLRFEALDAGVRMFSLVEGRGGETQLVDPGASPNRYWNFVDVRVE